MNIPAIDEQCTLCDDPVGNNDEVLCDQCYEDLYFSESESATYPSVLNRAGWGGLL